MNLLSHQRVTSDGGFWFPMVAAEDLYRGEIVYQSQSGTGDRATKVPADGDMPIGVVFQDVSSGGVAKIVKSGKVYVKGKSSVTLTMGYVLYVSSEDGRADNASTVPAALQHWRECGHVLVSASGNGELALCVVHFN